VDLAALVERYGADLPVVRGEMAADVYLDCGGGGVAGDP
jgi:hypothetical protein